MSSPRLSDFSFRQYPDGPQRDIARRFAEMAYDLDSELPDRNDDRDACMTLLLEARHAGVRAAGAQVRSKAPRKLGTATDDTVGR